MSIIEKAAQHLEGLLRQERPSPEPATATASPGSPSAAPEARQSTPGLRFRVRSRLIWRH